LALFTDTIAVYRAPLIADEYGSHRDWDNATVVFSGLGAALPYRRTYTPDRAVRETSRLRITVYLQGHPVIDSADRLLVRGEWFLVDGEAWTWTLGTRSFVELDATRVIK
jgi:hypothetical protein